MASLLTAFTECQVLNRSEQYVQLLKEPAFLPEGKLLNIMLYVVLESMGFGTCCLI